MKKIFTILSLVAVATVANAQTEVLNEPFSFVGTLDSGNNGWWQHSGTVSQLQSDGNVATLVAANTEDSNKAFTAPYSFATAGASYKVEYIIDLTVVNSTNLTTTGDYFFSLAGSVTTSNVTSGISSLPARLYVKAGTSGYLLGVVNNSGTGSTPNYVTTEVPYGTKSTATVTYDVVKDGTGTVTLQQATLKVGAETITNATGTTAAPTQIAGVAVRQGGTGTTTTGNVTIDKIVANTYTPVLGTIDVNSSKFKLVKNTIVDSELTFGEKSNVKVYNMNGQVVKSASVDKNSALNISSLAKGNYIVVGEVNGETVSQKIIKK